MEICQIAVLKHTLNTDLSPLTYIHSSLYSCVYKYNKSHNSYYFVLDKGFSENESNRYEYIQR